MKENIQIVLITVVLFAAGLFTGVWTQHIKPAPPPPVPFMGQFGGGKGIQGAGRHSMPSPAQIQEMQKRMETMRPQMEAFKKKADEIEAKFHTKMENILKPEQKTKLVPMGRQHGSPEDCFQPGRERFHGSFQAMPCGQRMGGIGGPDFVGMIVYKAALARATSELGLDAKQQAQLEDILKQRRGEILNLLDTTPPPFLMPGGCPDMPGCHSENQPSHRE